MRRWTWIRLGWAVGLAGAAMACGNNADYNSGPVTSGLVAAKASPSGDAQSDTVGQELANPLRIVVTRAGVPEFGAVVTWRAAATGAAFTPAASVTDNSGIATTRWSLGQTAGTETAQADLAGGGAVTFSATALAGAAVQLSLVTAGPVIGLVGSVFPQPLQARVVDQFGNAVAGRTVSWSVTAGSATVAPASVVSNAQGLASTTLTFGAAPGTVTLQAAAAGLTNSPASLTATAVASTATVQLLDAGGNRFSPAALTVAAGTTVTFQWVGGFHDVNSFGSTTFTSITPPVSAPHTQQVTFTQPGTYQYFCSVHGSSTGGMRGTIVVQ